MDQAALARPRLLTLSAWSRPNSESALTAGDTEPSDEVLLEMIGLANKDALSALFRRHGRQVWAIGRKILRDAGEAEDLVQEVFLYVYRRARLFDRNKGTARSWLIQIVYTQALCRRRKLKCLGFYQPAKNGSTEKANGLQLGRPIYDQTAEGLFGRSRWKRIVEELTEDQRETLRLHFFEGYTFAEIADRLGQSHRNIRNHHYRGLEKLRKHLAKSELNGR